MAPAYPPRTSTSTSHLPINQRTAWIYVRVSDESQEAGHSPEFQETKSRELAAQLGYVVTNIGYEQGSARTMRQRKVWQQFDRAMRRHKMDAIIVYSLSRLHRNSMNQIEMLAAAKRAGVDILSVTDQNGEDKVAVLYRTMSALFNEWESDSIRERSMDGTKARAAKGMPLVGGRAPYGYQLVQAQDTNAVSGKSRLRTVAFAPDPVHAERVRALFHYLDNPDATTRGAAMWMDAQGWKSPTGKTWQATSVNSLIRQDYYMGEAYAFRSEKREVRLHDKLTGEVYTDKRPRPRDASQWVQLPPEAVPPLVDRDLVLRVRAYAAERSKHHRPATPEKLNRSFLIGGLVRCSICNHTMTYRVQRGHHPLFTCTNGTKFPIGHEQRHTQSLAAAPIEAFAVERLIKLLTDHTEATAALARLAERREDAESELQHARTALAETEAKIARRKRMIDKLGSEAEEDEFAAELLALGKERVGWQQRISALTQTEGTARSLEATLHAAITAARQRATEFATAAEQAAALVPEPVAEHDPRIAAALATLNRTAVVREQALYARGTADTRLYFTHDEAQTLASLDSASPQDVRRIMQALQAHVVVHPGRAWHADERLEFVVPLIGESGESADAGDAGNEGAQDRPSTEQQRVAFSTVAISSHPQPSNRAAAS